MLSVQCTTCKAPSDLQAVKNDLGKTRQAMAVAYFRDYSGILRELKKKKKVSRRPAETRNRHLPSVSQTHYRLSRGARSHTELLSCGRYTAFCYHDCTSHSTANYNIYTFVLIQKLTVTQLVKKFPAFIKTRRLINVITTAATWLYREPD